LRTCYWSMEVKTGEGFKLSHMHFKNEGETLWGKKGVLYWPCNSSFELHDTCNSLYLYVVNVNRQVAWIAKLQLCQNNSFSTTMQIHYNCTYDVILTSLIVIYSLKSNMWHYEKVQRWKSFCFWDIDFHHPLWLLKVVQDCDMWHNWKFPHGILIIIWKNILKKILF